MRLCYYVSMFLYGYVVMWLLRHVNVGRFSAGGECVIGY